MTEDVLDVEVVSDETTFTPNLDHVPFAQHRSGWCMSGHHQNCSGYMGGSAWPDPQRKGAFFHTRSYRCPCFCHTRDLDSPESGSTH